MVSHIVLLMRGQLEVAVVAVLRMKGGFLGAESIESLNRPTPGGWNWNAFMMKSSKHSSGKLLYIFLILRILAPAFETFYFFCNHSQQIEDKTCT